MLKYTWIVLLLCLVACEKGAYYSCYIDNQTSYTMCFIEVNTDYKGGGLSRDTIRINANTNKNISTINSPDNGNDMNVVGAYDTIYIEQNDTLIITKDIHKRENWEIKIHKTGFMVKTNDYVSVFHITNDDFKKK